MANYQFVIDSSFSPFTFQEQLMPFTMYKDAYEKEDEKYIELQKNADNFSYLADTLPEGSKAREIYEGYANDLRKYGEDFGRNGLSMSNRRGLLSMRRRYQGEIGRLDKADTALQEEIKRRQVLSANDPSTLYATDNLSIDDFLDRKKPNDYSVSGNKLYERGVQIGASDSARIWSNPKIKQLNDAFVDAVQVNGLSPELLEQWRNNLDAIPSFRDHLNATLKEYGVTDHLTGSNLERARQSVMNGMINGAIYKRADNIQQNPDHITNYQQQQLDLENKKYDEGVREFNEQLQVEKDKISAAAAGSGSGSDGGRVAGYTVPTYFANMGTVETDITGKDGAMDGAAPVNIEMGTDEAGAYWAIKGPKTGTIYALVRRNSKGKYTVVRREFNKNKFRKDFGTFDDEYDPHTLKNMAERLKEVIINEKDRGYQNYRWYINPDNNDDGNKNGGFYIMPYGRELPTRNNADPLAGITIPYNVDPESSKK